MKVLTKKISSAVAAIRNVRFLPRTALTMLYHSLVESRLRFYNTLWGNCGSTLLNKLQLCLSQFQLGTSPPGNPRGLAQKDCPGGRDLTFESFPMAGNSTRAGILWKLKVKRFVRLLVLLVINRGCPKNC